MFTCVIGCVYLCNHAVCLQSRERGGRRARGRAAGAVGGRDAG